MYLLLILINQTASGLFRAIAAFCRNMIIAYITGFYTLLIIFTLGGFILAKGELTLKYKSNLILNGPKMQNFVSSYARVNPS